MLPEMLAAPQDAKASPDIAVVFSDGFRLTLGATDSRLQRLPGHTVLSALL
ncbi:hypothetical protein NQZ68_027347 [Dissostichus eleginoides]|nr:hypothetical protein NQZ68_027347 [Dissostichus eleginoides]